MAELWPPEDVSLPWPFYVGGVAVGAWYGFALDALRMPSDAWGWVQAPFMLLMCYALGLLSILLPVLLLHGLWTWLVIGSAAVLRADDSMKRKASPPQTEAADDAEWVDSSEVRIERND